MTGNVLDCQSFKGWLKFVAVAFFAWFVKSVYVIAETIPQLTWANLIHWLSQRKKCSNAVIGMRQQPNVEPSSDTPCVITMMCWNVV